MTDLKPCPFCGSTIQYIRAYDDEDELTPEWLAERAAEEITDDLDEYDKVYAEKIKEYRTMEVEEYQRLLELRVPWYTVSVGCGCGCSMTDHSLDRAMAKWNGRDRA